MSSKVLSQISGATEGVFDKMPVGFGFSAGDFISALELVAIVVDAVRDSGNACAEYRELVRQLFSLETALLQVNRLDFDDTQYAEYIALRQAASQCQLTIDAFWKKAQKYHGPLHKQQHMVQGSRLDG